MNHHPTTPNATPARATGPDRVPGGRAVDTAVAGAKAVADAEDARRADALADALDRLAHHGFTDGGGMAHHAPMGAEALSALGYHDQVASWVDTYNQRHDAMGAPGADHPLTPGDDAASAAALGDPSRLGDWTVLFDHLLHEQLWPDVVRAWVPRLLPGYGGAFTHGLLRTAHAVRTIDAVGSTPAARRELARALAWWAGTYTELPGRPGLAGPLTLDEAIDGLPRPSTPWSPEDAGRFVHLHELDGFAGAVDDLAAPRDPDVALGELTATYARMLRRPSPGAPVRAPARHHARRRGTHPRAVRSRRRQPSCTDTSGTSTRRSRRRSCPRARAPWRPSRWTPPGRRPRTSSRRVRPTTGTCTW